ncbi:hypothetical protein [Saccharothrix syringae]|uniref:Uncharacterized protein n=1 Tax=Saccharothrix syringae TaxID=103733 RepID=A0A5Q0GXH9_SACSY|nr:hypothetical protein [Saccharothrix syringae]QFZ18583.1 hypothetical protein EKG83_14930 [Saccharothrix syringae]
MSQVTERRGGVEMTSRMIGNALVVHPRDQLTAEARNLALVVALDPHHDLVVVDLPTGSPFSAWESVADLMPRPRRGVRIVIGGRSRETTALAGQWLAERLNRPVIAPDGAVLPGVGGSLFVDAGRRSGWIRFQPGKPPRWEAKRFPKPVWESEALAEAVPTSATGIAEPVGGGIWIRPAVDDGRLRVHRARLQENLPCQPDVLTVVLGCPDAPPISFDDVARFWAGLPEPLRGRARLLRYGRLSGSDGGSPEQALADFMGQELVWYTGLPVGSVVDPDVYTIRPGGVPGWRSAVRELAYRPQPAGANPPPRIVSHRPPVSGVSEVGPATYWYAPDAVVEVVPAGLWVRPPAEPAHAESVRATPLDAERHLMLFEAGTEAVAARMRGLAEDLVARLDPTTRWMSDLVAAGARTPVAVAGQALAELEHERPRRAVEASTEAATEFVARPVPVVDLVGAGEELDTGTRGQVGISQRLSPNTPPHGTPPHGTPPVPPVAVAPPVPRLAPPSAPPVVDEPSAAPPLVAEPPIAPPSAPPVATAPPSTQPTAPPLVAEPPATAVPPAVAPPVVEPALPAPAEPASEAPLAAASPTAPGDAAPDPRPTPVTAFQPVPAASAAAVLPKRGLEEERTWLRKTLNHQFASVANSVARVLSEHPSFQGTSGRSADLLTDAVAVRLYLSAEGDGLDTALRGATAGPHVPFARCAVAGLSRLPSHRGIAVYSTSLSDEEWALYRDRRLVTEWGFLNALTAPCARQEGDVDVLLWSMTGRRTKLLEPEAGGLADRVLFVPGTSFKVLGLTEPTAGARGRVLLRELAAGEIDANGRVDRNRVSLDELATTALRAGADKWASAERVARTPEGATARFQTLPGLVRLARAER